MKDKKAYMREYMREYRKKRPEVLEAQLRRQRIRNGQPPRIYRELDEERLKQVRLADAATLLGGFCQLCGHAEHLHFHHVEPQDKKCNVGNLAARVDSQEFYEEVDKCCLVCASCHKFIHVGKGEYDYEKLDLGWKVKNSQSWPFTRSIFSDIITT